MAIYRLLSFIELWLWNVSTCWMETDASLNLNWCKAQIPIIHVAFLPFHSSTLWLMTYFGFHSTNTMSFNFSSSRSNYSRGFNPSPTPLTSSTFSTHWGCLLVSTIAPCQPLITHQHWQVILYLSFIESFLNIYLIKLRYFNVSHQWGMSSYLFTSQPHENK